MEINDVIEIYFEHRNYTYLVTEKIIVEPEEVWVLESNNDSQMITLITCTPIKVGTHRLIIKGELQSVD